MRVCVCVRASYGLVGVGSWSPARKAESWGFTFHSGCLLLSLEINEPRVEVFFFQDTICLLVHCRIMRNNNWPLS